MLEKMSHQSTQYVKVRFRRRSSEIVEVVMKADEDIYDALQHMLPVVPSCVINICAQLIRDEVVKFAISRKLESSPHNAFGGTVAAYERDQGQRKVTGLAEMHQVDTPPVAFCDVRPFSEALYLCGRRFPD